MSRPAETMVTTLLLLAISAGMAAAVLWWGSAPYECSNCEPSE